nr:hypothetical protein [Tanacetum cinerariifolium]
QERSEGEAIDDRHLDGHHAQLQLEGDPGGAPDQDSQHVQR